MYRDLHSVNSVNVTENDSANSQNAIGNFQFPEPLRGRGASVFSENPV